MLTATSFAHSSLNTAYDRSGRTDVSLRSEPVRPVAVLGDQGSTSVDTYRDQVSLSAAGIEKSRKNGDSGKEGQAAAGEAKTDGAAQEKGTSAGSQELTAAETKMIRELQSRDREVRAHEMAHLASAGQHARGGASYTYQQGPDGRQYAIGGEVPIDTGKAATPEETIEKMEAVKQAALAPAEPSAADRAIAATAAATASQARQELQAQKAADVRQEMDNDAPDNRDDQPSSSVRSAAASEEHMPVDVFA
ncbi:putative metalloprotease CJM1_0395 family protein [Desulfobulbus sp.]|uniref:putative metalloprotease CJM1_0395 family protein n=1 Tax=Desulfobulbus sp. TaxID=895 RepID=UPI00286F0BD2|nr:putative metalloprotease CJM1_0395 family protein [Desulfobulbus sp.]